MKNERQFIPDKNWQFGSAALVLLCFIGLFVFFDRLLSSDLNRYNLFFLLALKWVLLSIWGFLFLVLVKFYVETRFALFIRRIERQMQGMMNEKPHLLHFRKKSFHNWEIDCLNDMIQELCIKTDEKEELLANIKLELEKSLQKNNFEYVKKIPQIIRQKYNEVV